MLSHEKTAAKFAPRSSFIRAARTNNPWAPPVGLTGQDARRYRDLLHEYRTRLGAQAEREDVRSRLRSLVWLTVELERAQDDRLRDKPVPIHTVLHMTQELRTLLAELGLNDAQHEPTQSLQQIAEELSDG